MHRATGWGRQGVIVANADLLKELRIEKHQREDHGQGPGRWPWIVGGILAVLVLAGLGGWLLTRTRAIEVQTAQAQSPAGNAAAGAVLQATGYVTARRQATVSAQITGTLTQVLIEEGDHVKKGQIVATLDDAQYKAALDAARTAADAAHALVAQYQAQLTQNQRDAVRQETLATKGLVAQQDAEQARTLVNTTRAQLVSQQRTAASADAQVVEARVNFDYCVIRAPFDGVITTKDAQIGEIISPFSAGGGFTRTGVGTVVDMDSLEVEVDVNEAYIGRVKPNMPAEAVLDAYPDWKISAHVIAIVPAADRGKATVKVRVALEQKDARIVPDMGVRVSFLEQKQAQPSVQVPQGALVPASAVVQRDGHAMVFLVHGDTVQQRSVAPEGSGQGELRLLPSGVEVGDTVVVSPPTELKDGTRVTLPAKPKE
jgi:RND family efflux transporter MFP subunit